MKERELEKVLKAFANKRRIAIISILKNQKEASVSDIAEKIKLSFKSTSKHLGILSSIDIVEKEQRSSQVFYKIAIDLPESVRKIISLV
jgi:DNA-binding transcriptional ArsR family regulator